MHEKIERNLKLKIHIDSYQSNKREYMVLAKPSRLIVAPNVSRLLLMISSGVTMTLLHNASSSAHDSHLCINRQEWKKICTTLGYSSAKFNYLWVMVDVHEKFCSHFKMEFWLFVCYDWRVYLLSLGKVNISKMKDGGYNSKNCLLNIKGVPSVLEINFLSSTNYYINKLWSKLALTSDLLNYPDGWIISCINLWRFIAIYRT